MDDRMTELEKKISFQELALDELTKTNLSLERRLGQLENQLRQMVQKMMQGDYLKKLEDEVPPPHY